MKVKIVTNKEELEQAFAVRKKVFVIEQGVDLAAEIDEFEESSIHVLAFLESQIVGTGRVRFMANVAKLERICVLREYRQAKLGHLIVNKLESIAKGRGYTKVKLHGQCQAAGFYLKLGFRQVSGLFIEENIAHFVFEKNI